MAIKHRLVTGFLLSLTIATLGFSPVSEAEAKGFDDLYHEKLALLKAKKLKKDKHHHFSKKHHFEKKHPVTFKKHRTFRRPHHRRRFGRSSFGKQFFFKHH